MPCGLSYEGPHQQLGMCLIPVSIKSRPVYDDGRRLRFTVPRTGSQIVHPNRRPLSSTAIFRFRPSCLRALWRHRRDPHYNNGGSQAVSCPGGNGNAARYGKVAVRRRPGHPRASGGRDSRLRPWLRRAGRRAAAGGPLPGDAWDVGLGRWWSRSTSLGLSAHSSSLRDVKNFAPRRST